MIRRLRPREDYLFLVMLIFCIPLYLLAVLALAEKRKYRRQVERGEWGLGGVRR